MLHSRLLLDFHLLKAVAAADNVKGQKEGHDPCCDEN
jgi:hypothetical protein